MGEGSGIKSFRENAWTETNYFQNHLSDHHVPSYLLNDFIFQESYSNYMDVKKRAIAVTHHEHFIEQSNEYSKCPSTLSCCKHNNKSFLLHSSGKNMDEIVITDCAHFDSHNLANGFSVNVGNGSSLMQVSAIGSSLFNTNSDILARTDSEIVYLRTVALNDYISCDDSQQNSVILEPIQKWSLPTKIASMSCSSSSIVHANLLGDNCLLYTWSPGNGFIKASEQIIFPQKDIDDMMFTVHDYYQLNRSEMKSVSIESCQSIANIESSLLPHTVYASLGKKSYCYDSRSHSVAANQFTAKCDITSLKQHSLQQQYLFVAHNGYVLLFDLRYPSKPVAQRPVSDAHGLLQYTDTEALGIDLPGGVLLGASTHSRQVFTHSVQIASDEPIAAGPVCGPASRLLAGATAAGSQNSVRWAIHGFPVVDRSAYPHSSLHGAALLPAASARSNKDSLDSETWTSTRTAVNQTAYPQSHFAFLVQQNYYGDVFAQKLLLKTPDQCFSTDGAGGSGSREIQIRAPVGSVFGAPFPDPEFQQQPSPDGTVMECNLLPEDRSDFYPLDSKACNPFVDNCSLKSCDLLATRPQELCADLLQRNTFEIFKRMRRFRRSKHAAAVRASLARQPMEAVTREAVKQLLEPLLPALKDWLTQRPLSSLWEVHRFVYSLTRVSVRVQELRQALGDEPDFVESYAQSLRGVEMAHSQDGHTGRSRKPAKKRNRGSTSDGFAVDCKSSAFTTRVYCKCFLDLTSGQSQIPIPSEPLSGETVIGDRLCHEPYCVGPHLLLYRHAQEAVMMNNEETILNNKPINKLKIKSTNVRNVMKSLKKKEVLQQHTADDDNNDIAKSEVTSSMIRNLKSQWNAPMSEADWPVVIS